jgi:hypothetical protein
MCQRGGVGSCRQAIYDVQQLSIEEKTQTPVSWSLGLGMHKFPNSFKKKAV